MHAHGTDARNGQDAENIRLSAFLRQEFPNRARGWARAPRQRETLTDPRRCSSYAEAPRLVAGLEPILIHVRASESAIGIADSPAGFQRMPKRLQSRTACKSSNSE